MVSCLLFKAPRHDKSEVTALIWQHSKVVAEEKTTVFVYMELICPNPNLDIQVVYSFIWLFLDLRPSYINMGVQEASAISTTNFSKITHICTRALLLSVQNNNI